MCGTFLKKISFVVQPDSGVTVYAHVVRNWGQPCATGIGTEKDGSAAMIVARRIVDEYYGRYADYSIIDPLP